MVDVGGVNPDAAGMEVGLFFRKLVRSTRKLRRCSVSLSILLSHHYKSHSRVYHWLSIYRCRIDRFIIAMMQVSERSSHRGVLVQLLRDQLNEIRLAAHEAFICLNVHQKGDVCIAFLRIIDVRMTESFLAQQ